MNKKLTKGLLGLGAMLLASQVNAATISMTPSVTTVNAGGAFSLTVQGSDFVTDVSAGGVELSWDPTLVTMTSTVADLNASLSSNGLNELTVSVTPGSSVVVGGTFGTIPGALFDFVTFNFTAISTADIDIFNSAFGDWQDGAGNPVTGVIFEGATVNVVPAAVWFNPDTANVAPGDSFTVEIVSDSIGLAGGFIDIGFDSTILRIDSVSIDPYWNWLPDSGGPAAGGIWPRISFDVFPYIPPTTGTYTIATLNLTALTAGSSNLVILGSSQFFNNTAEEIHPTLTDGSVNVGTVIDDTATVADDAVIGDGSTVGAGAVIEGGVTIGAGSSIGPNVTINRNVTLGDNAAIGEGSTIHKEVMAGDDLTVGMNVTIHKDVMIGARVTIGDNTVIHKGTVIGNDVWIGSDVFIGNDVTISSNETIRNSTVIPNNTTVP